MNQNLKKAANALFLVLVFALTVWAVFRGENPREIREGLAETNPVWLLPGILCVVGFILGESVVIYCLTRSLGVGIRLKRCCLYSFVGFFYSAITPSASGGQPMQVVYMRRDGIPVAVSTVVLAIVTITYKLVLVLAGVLVFLLRPERLMVYLDPVAPIVYLGMGLNVVCVAGLLLAVFHPNLVRTLARWLLGLLTRLRLFRSPEKQAQRLERILGQYQGTAEFFRTHKRLIFRVFGITVAQRFALFLVTWFTYRSFGLHGHSLPEVASLQAMISVAADMLPLPGGMGVSETLFLDIFRDVFGKDLVLPGMMLSRGISYYTQLILCAIITAAATLSWNRNTKKGREEI